MTSKEGSGMAPNVDGRPGMKKIKAVDAKQDKSCQKSAMSDYERSIDGGSKPTPETKSSMGSGKADLKADKE